MHAQPTDCISKQKATSLLCLFVALALAFYTGFRLPSLWSIHYYMPGLQDGFMRRAGLGTMLSIFGDLRFNYWFVAAVQMGVLVSLLLLLIKIFTPSYKRLQAFILLLLLSPCGGYLFHEVGYVDQALYLLLFLSLKLKSRNVAIVLLALSLFIHEIALFTTIPVFLAYSFLQRQPLQRLCLEMLLFSSVFLWIATHQTVPSVVLDRWKETILQKGNFINRDDGPFKFEVQHLS